MWWVVKAGMELHRRLQKGDTMEEFRVGDEVEAYDPGFTFCEYGPVEGKIKHVNKESYTIEIESHPGSWIFFRGELKLIRRANMYKQGDVLVCPEGRDIEIHGVVGGVYITTRVKSGGSCTYSQKELDELGYRLKPTDAQLVHLTIQDIADGKGVGVDPSLIRIKDA